MEIGSKKPQEQITVSAPSHQETTGPPGIIIQPLEAKVRLPSGEEIPQGQYIEMLGRALLDSNKRVEQMENYLRAGQAQQPQIVQNGGPSLLQQLIATGGQIASAVAQGMAHGGNEELARMAMDEFKMTHQLFVKRMATQGIQAITP